MGGRGAAVAFVSTLSNVGICRLFITLSKFKGRWGVGERSGSWKLGDNFVMSSISAFPNFECRKLINVSVLLIVVPDCGGGRG